MAGANVPGGRLGVHQQGAGAAVIAIRLARMASICGCMAMYWPTPLGFFVVVMLLVVRPAGAREIVVGDPSDALGEAVDACREGASTRCTLRAVVTVANEDPDVVVLRVVGARLERTGAAEDGNEVGDLDVAHDLTIRAGLPGATIDGGDRMRLLEVLSGTLRIENVVLRNGLTETQAGSPCSGEGARSVRVRGPASS
ncbi:MAG: hypothetical protein KIT14_16270 [bacterium]|nr:hypothetical protein [bacterium]